MKSIFPVSMGQAEVSDFLEKHPDRWYTSKEISEAIGIAKGPVRNTLKVFRERDEILFRKTGKQGSPILYRFKI